MTYEQSWIVFLRYGVYHQFVDWSEVGWMHPSYYMTEGRVHRGETHLNWLVGEHRTGQDMTRICDALLGTHGKPYYKLLVVKKESSFENPV